MILLLAACIRSDPPGDPAVALMQRLDADGSGSLTVDEIHSTTPQRTFEELDTDRDGVLSLDEVRVAMSSWEPRTPE